MRLDLRAWRSFVWLWLFVTAIKLWVAACLPLFVDEAFYWQEGRHLAWAYSDLPGLTAWLCRLGVALGGNHVLALRAPFLLLGALLPCWLARIATREFGAENGARTGLLVLLMPLPATLGVMALPDVPMALATVACLDACARLLRGIEPRALAELACGLAVGALSHYRFAGVIAIGLIALSMLPAGRKLLRDRRAWPAFAVGAVAWLPLLLWNLGHADAGLRFQLIERNPWQFQWRGGVFVLLQAGMATPLLLWAMAQAAWCARKPEANVQWRWFALFGGGSTLAYFLLGFFADSQRVSFHWTLPGFLALLLVLPPQLQAWRPAWRRAAWICAALGLLLTFGYYLLLSIPAWRAQQAGSKYYPYNFAGWSELAQAVREERASMPAGTTLLADNFKIGAELGFALGDADVAVLDHPLNHKHGRAPQLQLWQLQEMRTRKPPMLLIASSSDVKFRELVDHYADLCRQVGPLPPPRVVNIDHGAQRWLLFRFPAWPGTDAGMCGAPAQAYFDVPKNNAQVPAHFEVSGWAIKDAVGVRAVTVTLDGKPVAEAHYGDIDDLPVAFYAQRSRDPHLLEGRSPRVGFHARVDAAGFAPGTHWLGMVVHGNDGRDEVWEERAIRIAR